MKNKYIRYSLAGEKQYYIVELDHFKDLVAESEVGDIYTLEIIEMTVEEFDNLDEFNGF